MDVERLAGLGVSEGEMGGVEEVAGELEVGCEAGDERGGRRRGVSPTTGWPRDWTWTRIWWVRPVSMRTSTRVKGP